MSWSPSYAQKRVLACLKSDASHTTCLFRAPQALETLTMGFLVKFYIRFIKNHLSWRIDRDNLTDVQMEEMASSKCSQGCCLRRGEAYKYCSKQCWRWYIVEIKDREKHFLQCKTGCDFRCQNMYFAIPIDNNGDNNYCDQYKTTKLNHFEPNISPNDEHRDDGI